MASRWYRGFKGVTAALLSLVVMAVVYVAFVLIDRPSADEQGKYTVSAEAIGPLQAAQFTDPTQLARSFGVEIPYLRGVNMLGTARNAVYDGALARMVTLEYGGVTITAVRPSSAAPLLLRDELTVSTTADLTVLNIPVTLAEKGDARCAYMVTSSAAYSVYAPSASREDFFAMLQRLSLAH